MLIPTFGQPQAGLIYEERPGAYAILRDERNWIATVQTSYGYFLPGGGLDDAESFEQALHREVFEEIGLRLTNLVKIGEARQYVVSRFYNRNFIKHGHFFLADWQQDPNGKVQADHSLVWLKAKNIENALTHDFQKWMAKKSLGL